MKKDLYRAVSHWLTWADLDYPNSHVEKKIREQAEFAHQNGVNLVILFGFHLRWDFIYCFDTVHTLLKYITNSYHKFGIKVMDHHSAVCTHRPKDVTGKWDTFYKNHHHVPLTPANEIINQLYYHGEHLNSWRQVRVDNGEPCFIPTYQVEQYCVNNPSFRRGYFAYVKRLFSETDIDGLMADDVVHYGLWSTCKCTHCIEKFKYLYGYDLPPCDDFNFWGNYTNPAWRSWIKMRYDSPREFLQELRNIIGESALLTSCCSSSISKHLDPVGLGMSEMNEPLNLTMLEMCGEIFGGKESFINRIPDLLLHNGISERRKIGCLGLGYAYFPDSAFLIWSLNRYFGCDSWVSTLKGRLGVSDKVSELLPADAELVAEAYNFEKRHAHIFTGTNNAQLAIYYSHCSKCFNGDCPDDYVTGIENIIKCCFKHNIPTAVVDQIPDVNIHPLLLLSDCNCLSQKNTTKLNNYLSRGGTIIATGLIGNCDENGNLISTGSWLVKFGIQQDLPEISRIVQNEKKFFTPGGWNPARKINDVVKYNSHHIAGKDGWITLPTNHGQLYWNSKRLHRSNHLSIVLNKIKSMINMEFQIKLPDNLNYQIFKINKNKRIIHFMPGGMTPDYHPSLKNQINNERIVESIHYPLLSGEVKIYGNIQSATLYSADLPDKCPLELNENCIILKLENMKRFFSVEVKIKNEI